MSRAETDLTPPTEEAPSPLSVIDDFEQGPLVAIMIGSESDRERMQGAIDELDAAGSRTSCRCSRPTAIRARSPSTPRPPRCAARA